jgi:hypothetical protein
MLWPKGKGASAPELNFGPVAPSGNEKFSVSFSEAIACLAKVRQRLEVGDELGDDELAAVDVLTLALVRGSGK